MGSSSTHFGSSSVHTPTAHSALSAGRLTVLLVLAAVLAVVAYFQPLAVAALIAAVTIAVVTWARPFWTFCGLLLLLPFHDQMLRIATWQLDWPAGRVTLLSLWKEGAIALLFAVMLLQHVTGRRRMRLKLYHFDLWLAALALLSAAYVTVAANLNIGVYGFRNYFEPLAVFLLARLLPYSRQDLQRLIVALVAVAVVVAAFGIYQAEFIDFATMVKMGYVDEYGNLPYAFKTALQDYSPRPRAISTVTGPNQLAIYLNIFILLGVYGWLFLRGRVAQPNSEPEVRIVRRGGRPAPGRLMMAALLLLFAVCLLLTYSRGGLLALAVSVATMIAIAVYDHGIKRTWRELRQNRLLLIGLIAVAGLAGAGLVITGFARRVWRGLTGLDPAALGHLTSMEQALDFMAQHPLGVGIGMAGPRALRFLGEAQVLHTESTYLQLGMEIGVVGMALFLLALVSLCATMWRMRQRRKAQGDLPGQLLSELALVMWAGALAVFTVTPLMQNFLVAGYLWLLAGLAFHLDAYEP